MPPSLLPWVRPIDLRGDPWRSFRPTGSWACTDPIPPITPRRRSARPPGRSARRAVPRPRPPTTRQARPSLPGALPGDRAGRAAFGAPGPRGWARGRRQAASAVLGGFRSGRRGEDEKGDEADEAELHQIPVTENGALRPGEEDTGGEVEADEEDGATRPAVGRPPVEGDGRLGQGETADRGVAD